MHFSLLSDTNSKYANIFYTHTASKLKMLCDTKQFFKFFKEGSDKKQYYKKMKAQIEVDKDKKPSIFRAYHKL